MGPAVSRLHTVWVDGGYDGNPFMQWVMDVCRWIVQVVLRPQETKGFVLLPKRWRVERTFGWLTWGKSSEAATKCHAKAEILIPRGFQKKFS